MTAGGIYIIQRLDSDECYIGSAVDVARRWRVHRHDLRRGEHHSPRLQRVHDKHGMCAFEFAILEPVADKARLIEREQVWLDRFSPVYNTATVAGSSLGIKRSDEARQRMSASGKARPQISDETRANMSAASRGRVWSAETIEKRVAANRGRVHSAEARANMSASKKGRKQSPAAIAARFAGIAAARAKREAA